MPRFSPLTLISLLALSSAAFAQNLSSALSSRSELSSFVGLVTQFPELVEAISSSGGTVLAPSNSALTAFLGSLGPEGLDAVPESTVQALLTYHVLPQTLRSTDLVGRGGGVAETSLKDSESFANLEGEANVVFASAFGSTGLQGDEAGPLRIYSGVGAPANVSAADIAFDNGVVHVIESVLNLPQNASTTASTAGLSTLVSALSTADLVEAVDTTPSVTIFAPTNQAFTDLGVDLSTLSASDLGDILKYHVIAGTVGYSSILEEEQDIETLAGETVKVTKKDGKIWVNEAEVVQANVILSNGVVHVLNGVLTPPADGASPSVSSTTRRPTSPTTTGSAAEESDPAEEEEGSAVGLKASLFGIMGAAAALFISL